MEIITPEMMKEATSIANFQSKSFYTVPFALESKIETNDTHILADNLVEALLNEADNNFINTAKNLANQAVQNAGNAINNGYNAAKNMASNVTNAATTAYNNTKEAINNNLPKAQQAMSNGISTIKQTLQSIIQWLLEKLANFKKLFMAAMSNISNRIQNAIANIKNNNGFNNNISWYSNYKGVKDSVASLLNMANNVANFDLNSIVNDTGNGNMNINNLFSNLQEIRNNFKNIVSVRSSTASSFTDINSVDALNNVSSDINNTINNITNAITEIEKKLNESKNINTEGNDKANDLAKIFASNTLMLINILKTFSINLNKTLLRAINTINTNNINNGQNTNNNQPQPTTQTQPQQTNTQIQPQQTNESRLLEFVDYFDYAFNRILLEDMNNTTPMMPTKTDSAHSEKEHNSGSISIPTHSSYDKVNENTLNNIFYYLNISESNKLTSKDEENFEKMFGSSSKNEIADSSVNGSNNNSYTI